MLKEAGSEGVITTDYSSPKLLDHLEQAMQLGAPAIVKVNSRQILMWSSAQILSLMDLCALVMSLEYRDRYLVISSVA